MGLFNFSRSRSRSDSSSSSFDNLDQYNFGFGFDTSSSRSTSGGRSRSTGRSATDQRIAFEGFFRDLFSGASDAAGGIDTSGVADAANMLFTAGGGIIDQLQSGGEGAGYLEERLRSRDGLADAQIDQLGEDLQRFLSEDVSRGITEAGVRTGTLGGTRGEVQAGIAERGAAEAFVRGATDIRLNDRAARDAIAGELMTSSANRATAAGSLLPQLFGLAQGGANAAMDPWLMLAQVLGPQTTLTRSRSMDDSESSQFAESLAEALGINISGGSTRGRAGSQSRSSSSSSSRSFGMDLSGG